jgi:DNA-binding LacI/PurR family transcriptional regulator
MGATLVDVAEAAGVSTATASRVLSNSDYPVNGETRRKVLQAARRLGYQPNLVARSLRTDQTRTVGIVVENILSPFIPPMIRGIQDTLKTHHYFSIILNTDWDPEAEAGALRAMGERRIDGVILVESHLRSSDRVKELVDRPLVFVHRLFDSIHPDSVVPDDRYGARLATGHLAGLGHERIALINGPEGWDATRNRLSGYEEELAARGRPFDPAIVRTGDWGVQSGYDAIGDLVAAQEPFTAVFAANDLMALGAIYALQEAGRRVPGDVAVVGYDDRDLCGHVRPGITSVSMPCEAMGRASAELLLRIIDRETEAAEPVRVRGQLVVRESCGARKERWEFEPERASLTRRIAAGRDGQAFSSDRP